MWGGVCSGIVPHLGGPLHHVRSHLLFQVLRIHDNNSDLFVLLAYLLRNSLLPPACPHPFSPCTCVRISVPSEAHNRAVVLEMIGDLPEAEAAPPSNMVFVCKLNPVRCISSFTSDCTVFTPLDVRCLHHNCLDGQVITDKDLEINPGEWDSYHPPP